MRVCLDLRRRYDCGVGRVAFNVAETLDKLNSVTNLRTLFLVSPETEYSVRQRFSNINIIKTDSAFFSHEDMFEMPDFLEDKADIFWSNQFYISPFFRCPVITMIHDIWPIKFPEWLPNHNEVIKRHGKNVINTASNIIEYFEKDMLQGLRLELKELYRSRGFLDKFMFASMLLSARQAEIIVTCSNYSRDDISLLLPEYASKLRIMSPYINNREIQRSPQSHDCDSVLMVAKFDPRKNHRFFLESLRELFIRRNDNRKVKVYIIGDVGYRSFGEKLIEYAKTIEKKPHEILFTGTVSDDMLWYYYLSCDLLVVPSLDEGFGLPVLEGLQAGIPCLVARRGALSEVGQCYVHYTDLDSPAKFAEEIDIILRDKNNALLRAREGQEYVSEVFSFKRAKAQVENILRGLAY
jgi:glycosyltransferase involved in cell wall biosynthesis